MRAIDPSEFAALKAEVEALRQTVGTPHRSPVPASLPGVRSRLVWRPLRSAGLWAALELAQAGVKEYWTVEPYGVVERWTGDGLAVMAEIRDRLTTPLLPDFDLDVPELFR